MTTATTIPDDDRTTPPAGPGDTAPGGRHGGGDERLPGPVRHRPAPGRRRAGRAAGPARRRWLVVAAVAAGLAVRVLIGLTDDAPSTDETAYLRSGASLVAGDGFARDGRAELHFPPLVPVLLGLGGEVLADPHTGAVVLNVVAGTATVLPLALVARRVAGPGAGVATAWVAALTPAVATTPTTRGGGSEALYTLLVVTGAWLAVVAAGARRDGGGGSGRGPGPGPARVAAAAGAGLAVGLAYLTRPEGLAGALPLGLAVLAPALVAARRRRWRAAGRAGLPAAVAFAVPLLACVVPYALFLHDHTGAWALSAKANDASIEAWQAVARGDRADRDAVLYALDGSGLRFTAATSSLGALAREDPAGYAGVVATNVRMLARTLVNPDRGPLPSWQLLPAPVWALAGWGAWRMRRSGPMLVVLATGALPVATALAFFVQPRYLVVTAALAAVPVGVALSALPDRTAWVRPAAFVLLASSCALAFHGPGGWWHPSDHTSQRAAGEWVAAHAGPGDRVMARSMVVEYYAERPTIALPWAGLDRVQAFGRHYGVRYLVLDANTAERLRPQLAPLRTVDRVPGLRLVHEAAGEGGATRVFALDPPPQRDGAPPAGPRLGFVGDGAG